MMIDTRPAAACLRNVFAPTHLERLARESKWVLRRRETTGPALMTSILRSLGGGDVKTLAELYRNFNAHSGAGIDYKAFHQRLTSAGFPAAMRNLFENAMTHLSVGVIAGLKQGPFNRFEDILVHDGTSFAVHPELKHLFPGRFNKKSPAAVELHITMSLFTDNMVRVTLAPDVDSERNFTPNPVSMKNKLLLMDRGYDGRQDLQRVHDAGGYFAVRIRSTHKPRIINVYSEGRSQRRNARRMEGQKLDVAIKRAPKDAILDMDVCWEEKDELVNFARLVCIWNPDAEHWVRILTNLDRSSFSAEDIITTYKLRWQIELLNKELKSHANLRRFSVRDPSTMEGLIWGSLCAALLKRFVGQAAQLRGQSGAVISTQRVAKCGAHILNILCPKILGCFKKLTTVLVGVLAYLCRNARRSNPRRDNLSGRFKLGLMGLIGPGETV